MENEEIINLIREVVDKTGVSVKEVAATLDETGSDSSGTIWFQIEVDNPRSYLAHGGEGLLALNHLVRKIMESKQGGEEAGKTKEIMIDINGFQKKKVDNLRAVAHMMAERARYFKSNIEVDPMPAFDRRVVHEFLSNAPDLKTESEGTGSSRRVIIKYIGAI